MADSFTKLLLHANGVDGSKEIQDSGATGHIVSIPAGTTGTLSLAQAKFGICSLLLDGNSDYLTVPNNSDFDFGSSNFTIDCWVRWNSVADYQGILSNYNDQTSKGFLLYKYNTNELRFIATGVTDSAAMVGTTPMVANTWYHIAVTRVGNIWTLYLDGEVEATTTKTGNITASDQPLLVGAYSNTPAAFLNGYVDEVRVSNVARTITLPTSPYTSDTNTKLLLHMDSLDVSSTTAPKIPTFVGTAQISTAQKEFGSGSLLLDGNSDYVTVPDSADWNFGTGDFTIDFWINFNSLPSNGVYPYEQATIVGQWVSTTSAWSLAVAKIGSGLRVSFGTETAVVFSDVLSPALTTGQWYHMAIVRNGTTTTYYQDGTAKLSGPSLTIGDYASTLNMGYQASASSDGSGLPRACYIDGNIDELRISKGIARWTANFTPPTSEYGTWKGRAMLI